jgi:A nuclease family of the HNH/ENDO VII superfamily with conserved AHH
MPEYRIRRWGAVMRDFLKRRSRSGFKVPTRPGWHRHHILPTNIRRYPDLRDFLGGIGDLDGWLEDFGANGMFLPAVESVARATRLPLHRGPHRTYNAIVIDALDGIRLGSLRIGIRRNGQAASVLALQRRLRSILQGSALDGDVLLASRNPFGPIPLAIAMDRQTDALFAKAVQNGERPGFSPYQVPPAPPPAGQSAHGRAMH